MLKYHEPKTDNASQCPLCGRDNHCAMVADKNAPQCWCMNVQISRETLDSVPRKSRGLRCICPNCADQKGDAP